MGLKYIAFVWFYFKKNYSHLKIQINLISELDVSERS